MTQESDDIHIPLDDRYHFKESVTQDLSVDNFLGI